MQLVAECNWLVSQTEMGQFPNYVNYGRLPMYQMGRYIHLSISEGTPVDLLLMPKIHEIHRVVIGICNKLSTYIHKNSMSHTG